MSRVDNSYLNKEVILYYYIFASKFSFHQRMSVFTSFTGWLLIYDITLWDSWIRNFKNNFERNLFMRRCFFKVLQKYVYLKYEKYYTVMSSVDSSYLNKEAILCYHIFARKFSFHQCMNVFTSFKGWLLIYDIVLLYSRVRIFIDNFERGLFMRMYLFDCVKIG